MSAISGLTTAGNELMELGPRTFKPGCTVITKPKRGASFADRDFFLLQKLLLSQQTKGVYIAEASNTNHRKQKVGTQSHTLLTKGDECLATLALFSHSCLYTISLCPMPHAFL